MNGHCDICGVATVALDYCVGCSCDICPCCVARGCCGVVPAVSGAEAKVEKERQS